LGKVGDVVDPAKSGPDHCFEAENAAVAMAQEVWHKVASTVAPIVEPVYEEAVAAAAGLGSLLRSVEAAVEPAVLAISGNLFAREVNSIVADMNQLSKALENPAQCQTKLLPQGGEQWTTCDRQVIVQKVQSFTNGSSDGLSASFAQFDKQMGSKQTQCDQIDCGADDIYHSSSTTEHNDSSYLRTYMTSTGERARLSVLNGALTYIARDGRGQMVKQATREGQSATFTVKDETAVLDVRGQILHLDSAEVKLLQDREHAQAILADGRKIIRAQGKLTLLGSDGQEIGSVEEGQLKINGVSVFETSAQMNESNARPEHQLRLQVSAQGESRLIMPNGVIIAVRKDHTALIKGRNGEVLILDQQGKLWQQEHGQFVLITTTRHRPTTKLKDDGSFHFHGLKLGSDGRISADDLSIDLKNFDIIASPLGSGPTTVHLADGNRSTTLSGPFGQETIQPHDVIHVGHDGQKAIFHLGHAPAIEARNVIVKTDEIRLRHNDNGDDDTIVLPDNTVRFGGASAAVLNADGSMQLDERTKVNAQGEILSTPFQAGYDSLSRSLTFQGQIDHTPLGQATAASAIVPAAESAAANAEHAAAEICAKAAYGRVTSADIARLQIDKSSIAAILSVLSTNGLTTQAANLENLMGVLDGAMGIALPRLEVVKQS
jgi:tellurite resistance-related uncharacterized protein